MDHNDLKELQFIKKPYVDHLTEHTESISDALITREIMRHINEDQSHSSPQKSHKSSLNERVYFNKFTLRRNLLESRYDIKYLDGSHKAIIDDG